MTSPSTLSDAAVQAHPRPLWFWCIYLLLSLVAILLLFSFFATPFVLPFNSSFSPLIFVGYFLTTVAAGFTPRLSRTVSRAVTLVLVGAVFPLIAVPLLLFVFSQLRFTL